MAKHKTKPKPSRGQTNEIPTKASQASPGGRSKAGLPSLALSAIKIAAAPALGAFKLGLGTLPALAAMRQPAPPNLNRNLPTSAGLNSMQAQQTPGPSMPVQVPAAQSQPQAQPAQAPVNKDMVVAASTVAAGFAQAASTIDMTEGDKDRFFDLGDKMLRLVQKIEESMVDEQDTTIVHAAKEAPTTIVQQPFMPTEAPVPKSDFLTGLLSLAGGLVLGVGAALITAGQWLGALWTNYGVTLYNNVKNLIALGWSKVVTGFDAMSTWVNTCISTVTAWVDNAVSTVTKWVSGAADTIKNLWNSFDLSKLNILDFDLSGLWAKLSDLSVFGEWGTAVKNALSIFGGTALDTLKTVFDIAGKVWNFVKPVVKILGVVAKFMGPIGLLFGIASVASDIGTLITDAGAIVNAPTTEGKITAGKTLLAHAMRTIANAILPEWIVEQVFNSDDQDNANKSAKDAGIIEETGSIAPWAADYRIKDPSKLGALDASTLQNMLDSGDYSDEDEKLIKQALDAKKGAEPVKNEVSETEVIPASKVSAEPIEASPASSLPPAGVPVIETEPLKPEPIQPQTIDEAAKVVGPELQANGATHDDVIAASNALKQEVQKQELEQEAATSNAEAERDMLAEPIPSVTPAEPAWESEAEHGIKKAIADNLDITGRGTGEDEFKIWDAIDSYKEELKSKLGSTVAGFDAKFDSLSKKIMEFYYNTSNEKKKAFRTEMANAPAPEPPIPTAVAEPTVADGTVNISGPEPTAADPGDSKPDDKAEAQKEESGEGGAGSARAAAAADYATRHAEPGSTHYCARYVANSLQAAGYKFQRNGQAFEYVTKGTLAKMGFEKVDMKEPPKKGDVSVMGPRRPGHAGHISIFNGQNWVSDFVQRRESPYASLAPGQWMTRWRDTGNGKFDPAEMAAYEAQSSRATGGASATPVEGGGIWAEVLNAISSLLDPGGAKQIASESTEKPENSNAPSMNGRTDTGMELDSLLLIANGFD